MKIILYKLMFKIKILYIRLFDNKPPAKDFIYEIEEKENDK